MECPPGCSEVVLSLFQSRLGLPLIGAWFGCPLRMRPSPPPSPSARSASSAIRRGLIRPGHGSGSLMPLPIPCALAAWCLSPPPSKGRWSSRSSAGRSPSGSSEPQLPLSPRSAPLPQAPPGSCVACAMVPSVFLVHRHQWHGHKRRAVSTPGSSPSLVSTGSCAPMSWPDSAAVRWRCWASHRWGGCIWHMAAPRPGWRRPIPCAGPSWMCQ